MTVWRHMMRTALTMMGFTTVMALIMALIFCLTTPRISQSVEKAKLALLNQILPPDHYDNDLLHTTIRLEQKEVDLLGYNKAKDAYLAKRRGRIEYVILEVVAPDGYAGKITLLVGIRRDGVIQAVRVLEHKETPGLGDYIDLAKTPWIKQFTQQTFFPVSIWRIKKDGGKFSYRTGATITARAVVKAVHTAATVVMSEHQRFFGE